MSENKQEEPSGLKHYVFLRAVHFYKDVMIEQSFVISFNETALGKYENSREFFSISNRAKP